MKWFKHLTDSHANGKMRQILRKHGLEGYAFCWVCRELIGKEGNGKYRINSEKEWKLTLKDITGLTEEKINSYLTYQAEIDAIDAKALEKGDLYIPKLKEYGDEYSTRISRQTPDNVGVDKIRLDKIILEYIKLQGWEESIKNNPSLSSDLYKRNCKPAKQLILLVNNDDLVLKIISTMAEVYKTKGLSWTLETVIKHLPEFLNKARPPKAYKPKEWTPPVIAEPTKEEKEAIKGLVAGVVRKLKQPLIVR
uniref:Lin1244/Lin1753-like N-terminal domain-containing protein n=1 Tax=viral metagenome TaxID=1070528 RepID=A0A6H2A1K1_9ZZZZ